MTVATIQSMMANSLNTLDIFSTPYKGDGPKKFQEDPLVLACALKTLVQANPQIYYGLDHEFVASAVTDEIRDYAEQLRKYYTKKFFWQNLSDHRQLSSFRSRMLYLLEHRERQCEDSDQGIYYKLPWFYEEDMIYDEFKLKYKTDEVPHVAYGMKATKSNLELTYLKSTSSRQQKRKLERFWFTDGTYLYNIEVLEDNPLLEMFKEMIDPNKPVKVQAFKTQDRIDKLHFYKLFKFNFVKEQHA